MLFLAAFTLRAYVWFTGLSYRIGWTPFDADYYSFDGIKVIESYLSLNFSEVEVFHPVFTRLLIGVVFSLSRSIFPDNYIIAALLFPILFSSFMAPLLYVVGREVGGGKVGLLAALLYIFDPFSIRFSIIFLDLPMIFFLSLSFLLLYKLKYGEGNRRRLLILSGVFAGLAFSSKHLAIPVFLLLIVFMRLGLRYYAYLLLVAGVTYYVLNPHIWLLDSLQRAADLQTGGGAFGLPAILVAPLTVGNVLTYPWFILTYLGLLDTGPDSAPFVLRFLLLLAVMYSVYVARRFTVNPHVVYWFAALITPLAFMPRHYWALIGGDLFYPLSDALEFEGEMPVFMKSVFPYYYVILLPPVSVIVAQLLLSKENYSFHTAGFRDRLVTSTTLFTLLIFALLSPIQLLSNNLYIAFWDFFFVAVLNIGVNETLTTIGYSTLAFLTILTVTAVGLGTLTLNHILRNQR